MKKPLYLLLVFAFACAPIQPVLTPEQEAVLATADSTQINVDSLRVAFEADAEERAKDKKDARQLRFILAAAFAATMTFVVVPAITGEG